MTLAPRVQKILDALDLPLGDWLELAEGTGHAGTQPAAPVPGPSEARCVVAIREVAAMPPCCRGTFSSDARKSDPIPDRDQPGISRYVQAAPLRSRQSDAVSKPIHQESVMSNQSKSQCRCAESAALAVEERRVAETCQCSPLCLCGPACDCDASARCSEACKCG